MRPSAPSDFNSCHDSDKERDLEKERERQSVQRRGSIFGCWSCERVITQRPCRLLPPSPPVPFLPFIPFFLSTLPPSHPPSQPPNFDTLASSPSPLCPNYPCSRTLPALLSFRVAPVTAALLNQLLMNSFPPSPTLSLKV